MKRLAQLVRFMVRLAWLVVRMLAAAYVAAIGAAYRVARADRRRRHPRRPMPRSVSSLERRVARGPRVREHHCH